MNVREVFYMLQVVFVMLVSYVTMWSFMNVGLLLHVIF